MSLCLTLLLIDTVAKNSILTVKKTVGCLASESTKHEINASLALTSNVKCLHVLIYDRYVNLMS